MAYGRLFQHSARVVYLDDYPAGSGEPGRDERSGGAASAARAARPGQT